MGADDLLRPDEPPLRLVHSTNISQGLASCSHRLAVAGGLAWRCLTILLNARLYSERWQGAEKASGAPVTVSYIGSGENRAYLHRAVYDSKAPQQTVPHHWLREINTWRRLDPAVDLLLVDLPFPLSRLLPDSVGIAVPAWLKQKVPIATSWECVIAGLRRKTRREVQRLISKHELRARVVAAEQVAHRFYHELYRPYIQQRYRDGATVVSERRFKHESRHAEVIELLRGERLLGASLLRRQGDELAVVWTGLVDTQQEPALQGLTDALDYFSLMHAYRSDCRLLNLGGSRADLQDGLFRYKRRWGARVEAGRVPQAVLRLAPLRDTKATRSFLGRHSFIAHEGGALVGKSWVDSADDKLLLSLRDRLWCEGLSRSDLLVADCAVLEAIPEGMRVQRLRHSNDWSRFWRCPKRP